MCTNNYSLVKLYHVSSRHEPFLVCVGSPSGGGPRVPGEPQVSEAWTKESEFARHYWDFQGQRTVVQKSMDMWTWDRDHISTYVASLPTSASGTFQSHNK